MSYQRTPSARLRSPLPAEAVQANTSDSSRQLSVSAEYTPRPEDRSCYPANVPHSESVHRDEKYRALLRAASPTSPNTELFHLIHASNPMDGPSTSRVVTKQTAPAQTRYRSPRSTVFTVPNIPVPNIPLAERSRPASLGSRRRSLATPTAAQLHPTRRGVHPADSQRGSSSAHAVHAGGVATHFTHQSCDLSATTGSNPAHPGAAPQISRPPASSASTVRFRQRFAVGASAARRRVGSKSRKDPAETWRHEATFQHCEILPREAEPGDAPSVLKHTSCDKAGAQVRLTTNTPATPS